MSTRLTLIVVTSTNERLLNIGDVIFYRYRCCDDYLWLNHVKFGTDLDGLNVIISVVKHSMKWAWFLLYSVVPTLVGPFWMSSYSWLLFVQKWMCFNNKLQYWRRG